MSKKFLIYFEQINIFSKGFFCPIIVKFLYFLMTLILNLICEY